MLSAANNVVVRCACNRESGERGCRGARVTAVGCGQGLDLALFVDTKHHGLLGRIQVQTDDIAELLDETFVAAELEGLYQMGLQVVSLPNAANRRFAQPLRVGHRARAPVRCVRRCRVQRGIDDGGDLARRDLGDATRRGASFSKPAKRNAKNRCRHSCTVGREMRKVWAIA